MIVEANVPEGAHLGNSRKVPGELSSNAYDGETGENLGPVSLRKVATDDDETGHEFDIKSAVAGAVILAANAALIYGGRRVYRWWRNRKLESYQHTEETLEVFNEGEILSEDLSVAQQVEITEETDEQAKAQTSEEHLEKLETQEALIQEVRELIDAQIDLPSARENQHADPEIDDSDARSLKKPQ